MAKTKVAVVKTSPDTFIDDYSRLFDLLELDSSFFPGDCTAPVTVAADLSWHNFAPACSTAPWQVDAVIAALAGCGVGPDRIRTLIPSGHGIHVSFGEILNRLAHAAEKHGVAVFHSGEKNTGESFSVSAVTPALSRALDNISLPGEVVGNPLVLLPTLKSHCMLSAAGSLYTAFNALFPAKRFRAHRAYHDALAETLAVIKEACPSTLAVMDAAFAGEGPQARHLKAVETNVLLASTDPLALDTMAAKIMGFNPLSIAFISKAAEMGLGTGDPADIEIAGDSDTLPQLSFNAKNTGIEPFLWSLESSRSPLLHKLAILYDDIFYYVPVVEKRLKAFNKSGWFKVFESYRKSG